MKMGVYAMRDNLSGFMAPTVEVNDAVAMRNFEHAVLSGDSLLSSHPEDYSLCCIGTYDTETGYLDALVPPTTVVSALQVKLRSMSKEVKDER